MGWMRVNALDNGYVQVKHDDGSWFELEAEMAEKVGKEMVKKADTARQYESGGDD